MNRAAPRVSLRRTGGDRIDVGRDGLAILGLSAVLIVASAGLTLCLAMLPVLWCALRRPPTVSGAGPILVLGMRLAPDGTIRDEFRERLDRAAALRATMPEAVILVLGGVTTPGFPSEAHAGRDWLLSTGAVPADRIDIEPASRHTLENLRFCKDRLASRAAMPLVTSGYHLARTVLLARGMGLSVVGCPSDGGARRMTRLLSRTPWEALLIHWYLVGRGYARLARDARLEARIT